MKTVKFIQKQGRCIPPGVYLEPCTTFSLRSALNLQPRTLYIAPGHCYNSDLKIFLLVCGIRPVKDPAFLIDSFSCWHDTDPKYTNLHLVIVGYLFLL